MKTQLSIFALSTFFNYSAISMADIHPECTSIEITASAKYVQDDGEFKIYRSSDVNEGQNRTSEKERNGKTWLTFVTKEDGKLYQLNKKDGETHSFYVDEKLVRPNRYDYYKSILEKIEKEISSN